MPEINTYGKTHLPQYLAYGGFAKCGFVRHQKNENVVREFEKGNHNFLLHTNWLSLMGVLALDVGSKIVDMFVKCPPPHPQDVIEHVGSVDVEEVFFEPTCGSRFDVPPRIQTPMCQDRRSKNLLHVWMLKCFFFMIMPYHYVER